MRFVCVKYHIDCVYSEWFYTGGKFLHPNQKAEIKLHIWSSSWIWIFTLVWLAHWNSGPWKQSFVGHPHTGNAFQIWLRMLPMMMNISVHHILMLWPVMSTTTIKNMKTTLFCNLSIWIFMEFHAHIRSRKPILEKESHTSYTSTNPSWRHLQNLFTFCYLNVLVYL